MKTPEPEIHFQVLDRVVAQGRARLESMFRETMSDLSQTPRESLDDEACRELDTLREAYRLVEELIMELVELKEDLMKRARSEAGRTTCRT
jgi:hypothetical protein